MPSPEALLPLAESVADGSSVDWHEAEVRATTDEQAVIRQLRVLANLAALHRKLPAAPSDAMLATARTGFRPAIGKWAELSLVERLGGGTFGEVYRAWDQHLEREVALKLLRLDESIEEPQSSRIAQEGRLLARVRHPNVITVHGVEIHEGRVGLCMELVRGTTLEEVLQKRGVFSAREAALIGIDLCRALAAVHGAGLIHRDVKAQNVMREDGGRIVLMDLGTGREVDPEQRYALPDLAGTPLYLAPEIFEGAPASEQTDLYSLGVLLYHLVTGTFPVPATTVDELREAQATGTGIRLRDARADLPTPFVRVVDRAISREPARRYATAGAFEADLVEALIASGAADALRERASRVRAPAPEPSGSLAWRHAAAIGALVAAVLIAAAVIWRSMGAPSTPAGVAGPIRSIAVLPLKNFSGDPSQEYFADGMTDELIGTLGRLGSFTVISRTSVMSFKDSKKSLKEIADTLHVDAVLEGSVRVVPGANAAGSRADGQRVRINARLIRAGGAETLVWDRIFEKIATDVLALQTEVAKAVADGIKLRLSTEQTRLLARNSPSDVARQQQFEAFNLTLKGRYYWNMRTTDGLTRSLQYFQEAIEVDPSYAPAYAGQADAYNLLPGGMSPFTAYPLAKAAAARAIALDPELAEAQTSLAFASFMFDRNYPGAEAAFQRAIGVNPGYATAHHWYGEYLSAMGRLDEAFAELDRARALDPLSLGVRASVGSTLYIARRYADAIAELRSTMELDPGMAKSYYDLALAYAHGGSLPEAEGEIAQGLARAGRNSMLVAASGLVAAMQGNRSAALAAATELAGRGALGSFGDLAVIYAALGDRDRAFDYLEKADQAREPYLMWAKVDPGLDPLRSDPRFSMLLRSLKLAP